MNVYVVVVGGVPSVFADAQPAMQHAAAAGAPEVHECFVVGAPAPTPRGPQLVRHGGNGHQPLPAVVIDGNGEARYKFPPPGLPPGVTLGPDGKYRGPDGSELIRQPGPVPENRRTPPHALGLGQCKVCGMTLAPNGYCPRCFPQVQAAQVSDEQLRQVVQGWPQQRLAEPTPGAENM